MNHSTSTRGNWKLPHLPPKGEFGVFWFCFLISLAVYTVTLPPSITLDEAGQRVVAADYLGVPLSTGYPLWTALAWFFQWVLGFVTYRGHPNPAWPVAFMSAVFGALASGLLAVLIRRTSIRFAGALLRRPRGPSLSWKPAGISLFFSAALCFVNLLHQPQPGPLETASGSSPSAPDTVLIIIRILTIAALAYMALSVIVTSFPVFRTGRRKRPIRRWPIFIPRRHLGSVIAGSFAGILLVVGVWIGTGITAGVAVAAILAAPLLERAAGRLHRSGPGGNAFPLTTVCSVSAVAGGLLFAFSPGMWTQSVIVATHSLHVFLILLILLLAYSWLENPAAGAGFLRGIAFLIGLGMTNQQSVVLLLPALCVAFIGLRRKHQTLRFRNGIVAVLLLLAGFSFNAFMPVASEQNPPMNGSYARRPEGVLYALLDNQHETPTPWENLLEFRSDLFQSGNNADRLGTDEVWFFRQLGAYLFQTGPAPAVASHSIANQVGLAACLLALIPLLLRSRPPRALPGWMPMLITVFLAYSVVMVITYDPKLDIVDHAFKRPAFLPAQAVVALWASLGLVFVALLGRLFPRPAVVAVAIVVLGFAGSVWRGAERLTSIPSPHAYPGSPSQRGNDFGWKFGHHILTGMSGILSDLPPGSPPPPDPDYPPPLEKNAIFLGGSDPGRFVLSFMVHSAGVRPDVMVLTQNALADHTYRHQIRDGYGDRIWVPTEMDATATIGRIFEMTQSSRFALANGRDPLKPNMPHFAFGLFMSAELTRDVWLRNRGDHAVYFEEGYPVGWMPPYLEPHGLVMRLAPEKRTIPSELLQKDAAFWDWYSARLLEHPRFAHDAAARHAFSKLRVAMAGVFHQRGLLAEAEKAHEQAYALCPSSMEVVLRRSDFYLATSRVDKAIHLVRQQLEAHPDHAGLSDTLWGMRELERLEITGRKLEKEWAEVKDGGGIARTEKGFLLLKNYAQRSQGRKVDDLARQMIADPCLAAADRMRLLRDLEQHRRFSTHRELALAALNQAPENVPLLLEVAAAHLRFDAKREAMAVILAASQQQARETHRLMMKDIRFDLFLGEEPHLAESLRKRAEAGEPNAP